MLWKILILLTALLGVWAVGIEPDQITVRYTTIEITRWHGEHNNLRIAVLSDLHVGAPHLDVKKLQTIVRRTNAAGPDLIVLLGDFVISGVLGGSFVEPERIARELKNLRAPLGVVAVLGNHDWWYDGERVKNALQQAHIHVLENDVMRVYKGERFFWIVGLADLWTRAPDIFGTLKKIPDDNPILVLTHSPDVFPNIPERVSLTLAGHTHGGQVNLPVIGRPVVPSAFGQRYAAGHIIEQGRHLFVTTGIGTSIVPMRFCVPPEIQILTIYSPIKGILGLG